LEHQIVFSKSNSKKKQQVSGATFRLNEDERRLLYEDTLPAFQKGRMWNTLSPKHIFLLSDMVLVTSNPVATGKEHVVARITGAF
jgi:hypothetical protein